MAVGRGSMERAAKAAGTDNTRKSTEGKGQAPARRMTISEIVGETSMVEPPTAARRPADKAVGNKIVAVRRPEKSSAAESRPEAEGKVVAEESKAVVKKKPEAESKTAAEKKPEVESKAAAVKKPTEENKAVMAAAEKPAAKSEAAAAMEKPAVKENKAAVMEKTAKEAAEEIVYQRSSGMLERAAEPNERFGLGDAMPVYYF